jgi:hypothetical protein
MAASNRRHSKFDTMERRFDGEVKQTVWRFTTCIQPVCEKGGSIGNDIFGYGRGRPALGDAFIAN